MMLLGLAVIGVVSAPVQSFAADKEGVVPNQSAYAMQADVEDTFMMRECTYAGVHNRPKYNVTYRTLRFPTSYAKVGQRVISSHMDVCGGGPGHQAEYLKIQYQYRTW